MTDAFTNPGLGIWVFLGFISYWVLQRLTKRFQREQHNRDTYEAMHEMALKNNSGMEEEFEHIYELEVPYWLWRLGGKIGMGMSHTAFRIPTPNFEEEDAEQD